MLSSASRRTGRRTQLRATAYIVAAVAILLLVSAGMVLDAERDATGGNIAEAGDALWWSATTVTTVGYGDLYSITATGRLVAVSLMLGGVALLAVITASVAAWFVSHFTVLDEIEEAVDNEASSSARALEEITARLQRLEALMLEVSGRALAQVQPEE